MPEYFQICEVAKYYGVDPRDVMNWEQYWIDATFLVIEAKNKAQEWHQKQQERKSKKSKGKR